MTMKKQIIRNWKLVLLGVLLTSFEAAASNQCRGGGFTTYGESFELYKVKEDKAYYYYDWDECPLKGDCVKSRYLEKGDLALVSKELDGHWACVRNLDKAKIRHGWVKLSDLERDNTESITQGYDWVGTWNEGESSILEFTKSDEIIILNGSAIWRGGQYASDNEGGIQGELILSIDQKNGYVRSGNKDYDCQVDMKLVSDKYMVVTDNKKCGGTNVRFDGVFTKK